ncbi:hypothetical protein ZHAS_00022322 [Anopheles sinensis]|uniref:PDZ domain-containing protein n=1 Tax=Anopheles sinensis TaxID=74873 RepID=A0A084WUI4_ANOSI|nr:hypothetical protein ZHAS_00022322 [Anopheles sinensis]
MAPYKLFTDVPIAHYISFHFLLPPGVGVYISRIEEGSVAERAGLRPGDTILEVNGTPFTSINHEEALKPQYDRAVSSFEGEKC